MKNIIMLLILVLLVGCVNTKITETETFFENDKIVRVTEKIYPAPHAVKSIGFGLKLGFEVETKIPILWFGILKREYIVGNDKYIPTIEEEYNDINLLLGSGSAKSKFAVSVFDEIKDKEN